MTTPPVAPEPAAVPVLLDDDGYPTDEALDFLRTFTGSPRDLVAHLDDAMGTYGGVCVEEVLDDFDRPVLRVRLATGGWSGNEEIVTHLEQTLFWFAYWQSSQRGGAYTFHVPDARWVEPMGDWPPAHVFAEDRRDATLRAQIVEVTERAVNSAYGTDPRHSMLARAVAAEVVDGERLPWSLAGHFGQ